MKSRKTRIAAALLLAATTTPYAYAVGLGEIKVNSVLHEPLDARIQLTNIGKLSSEEMLVCLGFG